MSPPLKKNHSALTEKDDFKIHSFSGGKSTLMRQTALLTILAQIGAKVPAQEFQLSPVDR